MLGLTLLLAATLAATPFPPLVVALGDSTTAGTPGYRSPLEAPPHGAGDERSSYPYWLSLEGWSVRNRGVNGERADQVRARFERDVAADPRPSFVVILAGVNDVYQGRPLEDTRADLLWMYRRAKALGIRPVAATVLPFDRATPAQSASIASLNRWIRATAKKEGTLFADTAAAAASAKDPRRLKGSPDGLHPDAATYRAVAWALRQALQPHRTR